MKPLSRPTRRQFAQFIHRTLALAVYPARQIDRHPLPRGFLPRPGGGRPIGWLYPDEDAKLLGHERTPLHLRLLYGFLAREGMRLSEALALRATFVTIALANGRTEAWVSGRTGHKSSAMIHKCRRATMQLEELGPGDLQPLDRAIPELRAAEPDVRPPSPTEPPKAPSPTRAATRQHVAELVAAALSRPSCRGPPTERPNVA